MNLILIAFNEEGIETHKNLANFTSIIKLEENINQIHSQLWPYENAVIALDYQQFLPSNYNDNESLVNSFNIRHILFKMLKLLKYKQVLISIKCSICKINITLLQQNIFSIFNDLDKSNEEERNVFRLKNPEIKIVSEPSENIFRQFFSQNQNQFADYPLECIIIKREETNHIVKILSGQLYEGQLICNEHDQAFIKSITSTNKGEIAIVFQDDKLMEGLIVDYEHQQKKITSIIVNVQLCEIPIEQIKDAFRKLGSIQLKEFDQTHLVSNTYDISIELLGKINYNGQLIKPQNNQCDFGLYQLKMKLITQKNHLILRQGKKNLLFFFNQDLSRLLFYGELVECESVEKKRDFSVIFPYRLAKQQAINLVVDGQTFQFKCRICKKQKVSRLIKECGHLRYCAECIEFIAEIKKCYYCEKEITKTYSIDILQLEYELYEKSKTKNNTLALLKQKEQFILEPLPIYNQLLNQMRQLNPNFISIYCQICNQNICEQFGTCDQDHLILICDKCNCLNKQCLQCPNQVYTFQQQIKYDFIDDYQQI